MNDYPTITPNTPDEIRELLRVITRERTNDISDYNNIKNTFMAGRKTGRVPTGANDVLSTDRVGDFNIDYTTGYYYTLVNNAGVGVWARIPLETTW